MSCDIGKSAFSNPYAYVFIIVKCFPVMATEMEGKMVITVKVEKIGVHCARQIENGKINGSGSHFGSLRGNSLK